MKKIVIFFVLTMFVNTIYAQTGDTHDFGKLKINQTPVNYDSLLMDLKTRNSSEAFDRFYNEFIDIDPSQVDMSNALPDEVYEKRLQMMATEIQLPFNHVVKSFINVYLRKSFFENQLARAQYYFPIIEDALYRHNLPMELKMLPVIESALIPRAKSTAAAVGLWQFMSTTGKYYGLEINSFVDQRCDPIKSTEAACVYLKDLYRTYGDWTLVITAYNCGPGRVNKALSRVPNARTYWDIYDYLPRETRGYVPAFIAASYAYTYHKAHNMQPSVLSHPLSTDTLMIDRMMHFDQISTTLDIPVEVLRDLNPQYRIDIIPAKGNKYSLVLPQNEISRFITREKEIFAKDSIYLEKYLNVSNLNEASKVAAIGSKHSSGGSTSKASTAGAKLTHKVKSGETLGAIAGRYKVKVSDIQSWNNIRGTNIRAGQILIIYKK